MFLPVLAVAVLSGVAAAGSYTPSTTSADAVLALSLSWGALAAVAVRLAMLFLGFRTRPAVADRGLPAHALRPFLPGAMLVGLAASAAPIALAANVDLGVKPRFVAVVGAGVLAALASGLLFHEDRKGVWGPRTATPARLVVEAAVSCALAAALLGGLFAWVRMGPRDVVAAESAARHVAAHAAFAAFCAGAFSALKRHGEVAGGAVVVEGPARVVPPWWVVPPLVAAASWSAPWPETTPPTFVALATGANAAAALVAAALAATPRGERPAPRPPA